jgi:hypothetical protein
LTSHPNLALRPWSAAQVRIAIIVDDLLVLEDLKHLLVGIGIELIVVQEHGLRRFLPENLIIQASVITDFETGAGRLVAT